MLRVAVSWGTAAFQAIVFTLPPTVALVPRFFETYLKVTKGEVPPGLWAYCVLVFAAAVLTAIDKAWTQRREAAAKMREAAAKRRRIEQQDFFKEYISHVTAVVSNRVGEDFKNYLDTVRDAVSLRPDAKSYSLEEARKVQKETLKNICAAVAIYYKEGDNEVKQKFNASLMIPQDYKVWLKAPDGKFKDEVRFFDVRRDVDACATMLVLTCWAREPQGWEPFVLAVDSDPDYVLPGAPLAYTTGKLQAIPDTKDTASIESLMSEHTKAVKRQLRNYFEESEHKFRSFFSIPLILDGRTVGILSVQSKDPHILGVENEHQGDLELSLQPYCALLAELIVREDSVPPESEDG